MKQFLLIISTAFFVQNGFSQNISSQAVDFHYPVKAKRNVEREFYINDTKDLTVDRRGCIIYSSFAEMNEDKIGIAYQNNEDYTLHLSGLNPTDRISLRIDYLQTEAIKDVLIIYDGPNTESPVIAELSGTVEHNKTYLSGTSEVTLRFKSNEKIAGLGFKIYAASNHMGDADAVLRTMACNSTPAEDFCSNAPIICNLNGYCGNTSSQYTPTQAQPANFCGSIENNSWLSFIASGTSASFTFNSSNCSDNGSGIQASIYASSDCNSFTEVSNCQSQGTAPGTFTISTNVNLVAGQKYYIMVDGFGGNVCDYTVTAQSGVATNPQITASQTTVCPGNSATLTSSTTSANYAWSSSAGGTFPNAQTITVTPAATTTYTLTVDSNQCTSAGTATQTITVSNTLPPPDITAPTSVCEGDNLTLTTSSSGVTYQWSGPNGFSSTVQSPTVSNFTAANNGTYQLIVSQGASCTSSPATINITVKPTPVITLTPANPSVCSGGTVSLTAGGGTTNSYTWNWNIAQTSVQTQMPFSFFGCISNPFSVFPGQANQCPTAVATPTQNTQICVSSAGANGCIGQACTNITIVTPNPVTANGDTTICSGESATVTASASGNWTSDPVGFTATNVSSINVNPSVTTIYIITAPNCSGGSSTDSVTVTVNPKPDVSAGIDTMLTCTATSVQLNATSITPSLSYSWSGPNGFTANVQDTSTTIPGTYIVEVTNGSCSNSDTMIVSPSSMTADAGLDTAVTCTNPTVELSGSGSVDSLTYSWSGPNGFSSSLQNPVVSDTGLYILTVTDTATNCSASDQVMVFNNIIYPIANAGTDSVITCRRPSVSITGATNLTANYSVSWSSNPSGYTSVQLTNDSITEPQEYIFTVTNNTNGCASSDTVVISRDTVPPVADAGSDQLLTCLVTTVQLGTAAVSGNSYAWTGPASFADSTTAMVNVTTAGGYQLTVTDSINGCSSLDSVYVSTTNTLTSSAGSDTSVTCINNSIQLTGSSAVDSLVYSWSGPNGFTSSLQNPTVTDPGIYTLTVTDTTDNCSASDQVNVANNIIYPSANAGTDSVITCTNTSVSIAGTTNLTNNYTVGWTSNPAGYTSASAANSNITIPQEYIFTVTNNTNGCSSADTVGVTQTTTPPVANAGADTTLTCAVTSVQIGTTGTSGNAYSWAGPGSFNAASAITNTSVSGIYHLTVIDSVSGCSSSDSVQVLLNNTAPTINAGQDTLLTCTVTSINLSGTVSSPASGFTVAWTNSSGSQISSSNTAAINASGTYTFTVTNSANGCSSSDALQVTNNTTPPSVNAGTDATVTCTVPNVSFTATSVTPNVSYQWSGPGGFSASGANINALTTAGTYTVTATNPANGCTNTDNVNITVNTTPPTVSAQAAQLLTCNITNTNITGVANGAAPFTPSYSWTGPNGFNATTSGSSVSNTGVYVLTVTNTANGCSASDTAIVQSVALPTVEATASQITGEVPLVVNYTAASPTAVSYEWTLGGNTVGTSQNVPYTFTDTGAYTIVVTATDINGCQVSDSVTVVGYMFLIPNIFSPNGDGVNDVFKLKANGLKELDCEIFNRWGKQVATFSGAYNGWDGDNHPEGIYYYIVKATDIQGKEINENGYLQLVK